MFSAPGALSAETHEKTAVKQDTCSPPAGFSLRTGIRGGVGVLFILYPQCLLLDPVKDDSVRAGDGGP